MTAEKGGETNDPDPPFPSSPLLSGGGAAQSKASSSPPFLCSHCNDADATGLQYPACNLLHCCTVLLHPCLSQGDSTVYK